MTRKQAHTSMGHVIEKSRSRVNLNTAISSEVKPNVSTILSLFRISGISFPPTWTPTLTLLSAHNSLSFSAAALAAALLGGGRIFSTGSGDVDGFDS